MPCDDSLRDENLSTQTPGVADPQHPNADTNRCISIDDGPGTNWWLSPDICLNGGPACVNGSTDQAQRGTTSNPASNNVDVRVHRAPATCQLPSGTSGVVVELWVSPPGLNLSPLNAKQIKTFFTPVTNLAAGSSPWVSQAISPAPNMIWTLPDPADPNNPIEQAGHKCLIARCYPDISAPADSQCFHVTGDTHVAQRNIDIVSVSTKEPTPFPIWTGNTNQEKPEQATIRVVTDLKPDKRVLDILTPGLKQTPGFVRVANTPPAGFSLRLPDFPEAKVRDNTRPGCIGGILSLLGFAFQPSYEADVKLKPGQVTTFYFAGDFSKSTRGDAHIFHLMHMGTDKQVIGGLTLVAVVI